MSLIINAQTALASGGLDEALIDALSERLLDQVNIERAKGTLPPLRKREAKNKKDELPTYSWNDTCKVCSQVIISSIAAIAISLLCLGGRAIAIGSN